ncbi:MAG: hypothetical protein HZA28_08160 [Candidatus Omnitrophica bacterium]|nr:hypothetical protein [Candidatus Omnitrophota bacterium]
MVFNRLKDIAEILSDFAFKNSNINNNAQAGINIEGQKCYPFDINEKFRKFLVRKGDVLIALPGATTGKSGIYNSDKEALLNQRVALIRGQNCRRTGRRTRSGLGAVAGNCGRFEEMIVPPCVKSPLKSS